MNLEEWKATVSAYTVIAISEIDYSYKLWRGRLSNRMGDLIVELLQDEGVISPSEGYGDHCCPAMAYHIADQCESKEHHYGLCPDQVIRTASEDSVGLPIHDGGASFITINFCPWCGHKLRNAVTGQRKIEIEE